jgi:pimeloyl-ACP methyl ester carboxylesterase
VIDPLAAKAHVFAPNFRGHGLSTWTPGHYRLFDYVDDIAAFLGDVVREPAILLGHSLGGEIALIVAALHPSTASGVINEDGPLSAEGARRAILPGRPMLEAMRELAGSTLSDAELIRRIAEIPVGFGSGRVQRFGDIPGVDQKELQTAAESYRHHDPTMLDAVIEFEQMHADYDGDALLPRIQCPVAILQADPGVGRAITDAEIAHAMTLLRDGRHIPADGVGHSMHISDPEWFVRTVLALIDEFSPG